MNKRLLLIALTIALAAALVGGATMAIFWDYDAIDEPVQMTAGTILVEAGSSMIYGIERGGDRGLYEIDVSTGAKREFFKTDTGDSNISYPNALAFDKKNSRLYYADSLGRLYFYDFGLDAQIALTTLAGGQTAGATFGRGYYWYIPQNSNNLYHVSFNPDGSIDEDEIFFENFAGDYVAGDIAMDMQGNIIYGSGSIGGTIVYFKIDLSIPEYTQLATGFPHHMQLAFGSDGKLYGHRTSDKKWYDVGLDSPYSSQELGWSPGLIAFNDLASNWQGNWNPGDCDMARFHARNVGTKNQYVRVTLSGTWQANDSLDDSMVTYELCPASTTDWHKANGYFYYKGMLAPGEEVILCVLVCFDLEAGNEYQGQTFELNAEVEAIQSTHDAWLEAGWGYNPGGGGP